MSLNCFIVDDEPLAIEVIQSHIEKVDGLQIAGTFNNAIDAFDQLCRTKVDVIFLDIQMPKLTGIDFLKTLKDPPRIIFTTAYREFALEGFELDAVDYLLKPISFERFLKSVGKLFTSTSSNNNSHIVTTAQDALAPTIEHIFVPSEKRLVKITLSEITFIESQRDYVRITTDHKEVLSHQSITYMEENLPKACFLRIHRSFIINLDKIESWSHAEIELPGITVPIGRTYKNAVVKKLQEHTNLI